MTDLDAVTQIIALGTVGLQITIIIGVLLYVFKKDAVLRYIGKRGMVYAYILSLFAMIGSLYYSEVMRLEPCVLCWYQRIPMYANVFILGFALYKKDIAGRAYAHMFAVIGIILALYHVWIQNAASESVTCSLAGGVSCSESYFTAFGYVTIPVISLTTFVAVCSLLWLSKKYE